MTGPATLLLREWSRVTPAENDLLQGLTLTRADRELLDELSHRTSLRVEELRQGLRIEVGPHIGSVTLSGLRIVIIPKLPLTTLMAMIAYAFELSDLVLGPAAGGYTPAEQGFADLLGVTLLRAVERIARRGLLPRYRYQQAELASPHGRIDMNYAATRPRSLSLRCHFTELTADHILNQALAAGLRLASHHVQSLELRLDLVRAADRLFGEQQPVRLDSQTLARARTLLDRRSRDYKMPLLLVNLFWQGSSLGAYEGTAGVPLAGFLLDMNRLFERFLALYLQRQAPEGIEVVSQDLRSDVFSYLENPHGWRSPTLRPDLVFLRHGCPVAIGDAKYRNHRERPPSTAELYQLTTYALAYPLVEPRQVYLFYPLEGEAAARPARLLFTCGGAERVCIHLLGVPVDGILLQPNISWWPLENKGVVTKGPAQRGLVEEENRD